MESMIEVIQHVFLGSSSAMENADLLREHGITYLLGVSNNHSLNERKARQCGLILGSKNVHVKDTVLEVVEECNNYIQFCRITGCNLLIHSPGSLPLSSLLIVLYMNTVSECQIEDVFQLLRFYRPDHEFEMYRREWAHYGSRSGPCRDEMFKLGDAWGWEHLGLSYFDYAILTQLQMEARRTTRRVQLCTPHISDKKVDQLLTWKSLDEYRRSLLLDKAVKEEALRRELKERRREEKYQMAYVPDYKLTYDCHEFDESILHNARLIDFYLPSSIDSMISAAQCPL